MTTHEKHLAHGKHTMMMANKDRNPLCNTNPGLLLPAGRGLLGRVFSFSWLPPKPHSQNPSVPPSGTVILTLWNKEHKLKCKVGKVTP